MTKFYVCNQHDVSATNGSLQGTITLTYAELVVKLGEPTYLGSADEKSQAEWVIEFEDDDVTTATVYDWKEYDTPKEQVTEWHIGGTSQRCIELVNEILGKG